MRYIFSFFIAVLIAGAFPAGVSAARFCSLPQGVLASQDLVLKNTEVNCYEDGSFFYTSRILPMGTTMTFVNYSKEPLRVASGPHPMHNELGDFDSVKDLGENEWYSYTFIKRGVWGFHNHDQEDVGGEVTIVGKIYDTSKEKPPRINIYLPTAPKKDALPKNFEKLKTKKNTKQLKKLAKKELKTRLNTIRSELDKKRWWKEAGKNPDSSQAQGVFQELQGAYQRINGYTVILNKGKDGKSIGDVLKKIIDERVLSTMIPRAQLLLEIDALRDQSEQLEDYLLQAESSTWLEEGDEKEAVEEQFGDAKETLNDLQESLEETRDTLMSLLTASQSGNATIKSARVSFEKAIKNARAVERALIDVTQNISKLSAKQSDGKLFKEIADGEACKEYRGYSAATIELVCYQDTDYKLWNYVKTGRKVIFYNASSEPMWIASNPHPAHSDLAGFDQGKAVPKGGTYEYTFAKPGKYYFHNHINPQRTGKIKVSSSDTIEIEAEDMQMNQPLGGWPPITNE